MAAEGQPVVEALRGDRLSATDAISQLVDPGSWRPWFESELIPDGAAGSHRSVTHPGDAQYRRDLEQARAAGGQRESVVVGEAAVGGVPAGLLVWEFGFLGGSIGVATATLLVAAIRRATRAGLPLLALPRSGGTRMQEGTPAFVQMTAITAAVAEHRAAGLPYLVHLCHPTTGGVLATLGSAGDLTTAEPGAMVGFLGPRAVAAITGRTLTPGVQAAERLIALGIVDETLEWADLRTRWAGALGLWRDRPPRPQGVASLAGPEAGRWSDEVWQRPSDVRRRPVSGDRATSSAPEAPPQRPDPGHEPATPEELWAYVSASRNPERLGASAWLDAHLADRIELTGTGAGEVGSGVRAGLARLAGSPVAFAATIDRETGSTLTVHGLRVLRRVIALAGRWGLPVLTVVDTLGAELSDAAEAQGIAGEISRTMLDLVACRTPTVGLLMGPGTGGSALSLLAVDRLVATSHSWVAPLPPEGAAVIRHHGSHDPALVAWQQQVGVHALAGIGFVDVIVDESSPDWPATVASEAAHALAEVGAGVDRQRRVARFQAWSNGATR